MLLHMVDYICVFSYNNCGRIVDIKKNELNEMTEKEVTEEW